MTGADVVKLAEELAGAGLCPAVGTPPLADMSLCNDEDGDCCLVCWTGTIDRIAGEESEAQ